MVAEIVMDDEKNTLDRLQPQKALIKCVDGLLSSPEGIDNTLQNFNSYHEKLQFVAEIVSNNLETSFIRGLNWYYV